VNVMVRIFGVWLVACAALAAAAVVVASRAWVGVAYARLRRPLPIEFIVRQADVRPNDFRRQVRAAISLWQVEQVAEARVYVERATLCLRPACLRSTLSTRPG